MAWAIFFKCQNPIHFRSVNILYSTVEKEDENGTNFDLTTQALFMGMRVLVRLVLITNPDCRNGCIMLSQFDALDI